MIIIDFILHCNEYIGQFIQNYGAFVYVILFLIIFCETGLVFLPFLPGDSLIFAAGAFAAIGETILKSNKFKMIKQENVDKANALINKYGGAAVFIARFMPIVRTMVPFLVGMGKLEYKKFIKFNAIGGIVWVTLFWMIGYFFGNIPAVKEHFTLILLSIIFISLLPMIIGFINSYTKKKKNNK